MSDVAVGIDGWKSGWIAVVLDGAEINVEYGATLQHLTDLHGDATIVVDVPIGLPTDGRREADIQARAFVGPRRSSVFFAPPAAAMVEETYQRALAVSRERFGFGISAQSYALRNKILEAQELIDSGATLYEGHPEVSFAALKGGPLEYAKRTWNGQMERRRFLTDTGIAILDTLPAPVAKAPPDDVLDAAVMAWTARRVAAGDAGSFPEPPAAGVGQTIWY